jgi:hypothetical protein
MPAIARLLHLFSLILLALLVGGAVINGSGRTSLDPLFPGALSLSGALLAGFILLFPGHEPGRSGARTSGPSAAALFTFACCLLFLWAAPRLSFFMNYEDWLSAGMPEKSAHADPVMLAFVVVAVLAGLVISRLIQGRKRVPRSGGGAG